MNASIPTEVPQNVEHETGILFARIEEKMAQIRRDREEGQAIQQQSKALAQTNARMLDELGELFARLS